MEANEEWSYLQETKDSVNKGYNRYLDKMSSKNPNDALSDQDSLMFNYLVGFSETASGSSDILKKKVAKLIPNSDKKNVDIAMTQINKSFKNAGWDGWNPPSGNPTVAQHKALVKALQNVMNYNGRISKLTSITQKQKKELIARVRKEGYEIRPGVRIPLQYYAH